jgi:hypothetical protein
LKTDVAKELRAAVRVTEKRSSMDDEFYKDRARHIRELADKADPFIRKRLLDLASNYDAMIRRSPRKTTLISSNLSKFPSDRPSGALEEGPD